MRYISTIFVALLLLFGCNINKLDINRFSDCNKVQSLDSVAIRSKLIGAWKWSQYHCSNNKLKRANKKIDITFKADQTFVVKENDILPLEGKWELKRSGSYWELSFSPSVEQLYGRILFCNDTLFFNDSYVDGCDNLFIKSN